VPAVAFAWNTAHPAVWVGSTAAYAATPRLICPPLAAVQGGSGGWVLPLELHAARIDDSPAIQRCLAIT